MAARATSKAKPANSARSTKTPAAKKVVVAKKALPAKTRRGRSTNAKKAPAAKTSTKPDAGQGAVELDALAEQNRLLRADLKRAQARIRHLEELNKNVVNRIDWVIDSLQSVLKQ